MCMHAARAQSCLVLEAVPGGKCKINSQDNGTFLASNYLFHMDSPQTCLFQITTPPHPPAELIYVALTPKPHCSF